jgi:hypothetical protein
MLLYNFLKKCWINTASDWLLCCCADGADAILEIATAERQLSFFAIKIEKC